MEAITCSMFSEPPTYWPPPYSATCEKGTGFFQLKEGSRKATFQLGTSFKKVPRIRQFLPRLSLLEAMRKYFFEEEHDHAQRRLVLHGHGGMGKTQLALGFARQYQDLFSAIFFINAQTKDSIIESFRDGLDRIYANSTDARLALPERKPTVEDEIVSSFLEWLAYPQNDKWLLLYDNVGRSTVSDHSIEQWLPSSNHGNLIITTRLSEFTRLGNAIGIETMTAAESSALLKINLSETLPTFEEAVHSKPVHTMEELTIAEEEILKQLHGSPLAIAQASQCLQAASMNLAEFAELLSSHAGDSFESAVLNKHKDDDPGGRAFATWKASMYQIRDSPIEAFFNAAQMLILLSYIDPHDISYDLIQFGLLDPEAPTWFRMVAKTRVSMAETMGVLVQHGLLNDTEKPGCYAMHDLSHAFCQEYAALVDDHAKLTLAISIVGFGIPQSWAPDRALREQRSIPHVNTVMSCLDGPIDVHSLQLDILNSSERDSSLKMLGYRFEDQWIPPEEILLPLDMLAGFLHGQSRFDEARKLLEAGFAALPASTSNQRTRPELCILWSTYAWTIAKCGEPDKAVAFGENAVRGLTTSFGPNALVTIFALDALAASYYFTNQLEQCRSINEDMLSRITMVAGEQSLRTQGLRRKMAYTLDRLGKREEALEIVKSCTAYFEKELGSHHPATLLALSHLAELTDRLSENSDVNALALQRRTFQGYRALYGMTHERTITEAKYLADMLERRSEYDDSIKIRQEVVEAVRGQRETDNIAIAHALLELGKGYLFAEQTAAAEDVFMEVSYLARTQLQQDSAVSLVLTVSSILVTVSRTDEAIVMLEDCLQDLRSSLTPWHPSVIRVLGALAEKYGSQERPAEIARVHNELINLGLQVSACEDDIGDEAMRVIGDTAIRNGNLELDDEATVQLAQVVLNYFSKHGGDESVECVMAWSLIGKASHRLHHTEEATKALSHLAGLRSSLGGVTKLLATDAIWELSQLHEEQGDMGKAEDFARTALNGYRDLGDSQGILAVSVSEGMRFLKSSRYAESRDMFEIAESVQNRDSPKDNRQWLIAVSELGQAYRGLGNLNRAEEKFKIALAGFEKDYGETNNDTLIVLRNLYHTLWHHCRYSDAKGYALRLQARETEASGPHSVSALTDLLHLGILCACMQEFEEANSNVLHTLDGCVQELGTDHWRTARALKVYRAIEDMMAKERDTAGDSNVLPGGWYVEFDEDWVPRLCTPEGKNVLGAQPLFMEKPSDKDVLDIFLLLQKGGRDPATSPIPDNEIDPETLPEDIQCRLACIDGYRRGVWTYSAHEATKYKEIPLYIKGMPVVILPPDSCSRLDLSGEMKDPWSARIDPANPLMEDVISCILSTYPDAMGFYLLLSGHLQLILPSNSDHRVQIAAGPGRFGGLKVMSVSSGPLPTASVVDEPTETSTVPKVWAGLENLLPSHPSPPNRISLNLGGQIEARLRRRIYTRRRLGRVGLRTRAKSPHGTSHQYLTVSTHVLRSACQKNPGYIQPSILGNSDTPDKWYENIAIYASDSQVGDVVHTFDKSPDAYPCGYSNDVSLVEPHDNVTVHNAESIHRLRWLAEGEWDELRATRKRVWIMGNLSDGESLESLKESDYAIVGQGIFRLLHPNDRRRMSAEADFWSNQVARCVLYRTNPPLKDPWGMSGAVVVADMASEKSNQSDLVVVGFHSFLQPASPRKHMPDALPLITQESDPEEVNILEAKLRESLEEGEVAFYGAFQVPNDLREHHHIH